MNKYISPVKTIAKYLLVIATVFAVLGNIVNWLTLYITGTGIGASHGATLTFSIVGFILGTTVCSAALFAIFGVATGLALLLYVTIVNIQAKINAVVPTKPNTPEQNSTRIKLALLALLTDIALSALISVMSSSAMYAMLSAISDKHGLILTDVGIYGFLSFCFFVPGLGFIGTIAFLVFAFIALAVFGSSSPKKAKSKTLSKVALLCLIALPLSMTGCAFDGNGGGGVIVIDPSPCGEFGCPLPPPYFPGGPGGPGRHGGFGEFGGFGGGGQNHGGFNRGFSGGNRNSGSHSGNRH
jgi:uncharacterized membrane protein YgcG